MSNLHLPDTDPLARQLRSVRTLAAERGERAIAAEADELSRRCAQGRFLLAVVGQFKRGKSTLVNSLLGERVLPTGVVPVTAVVTLVEHAEVASARVVGLDGAERAVPLGTLADYVTEEGNPGNRRGVALVRVLHAAPLLASGVSLVDTPGVGSVFEVSTAATRAFVPRVDAALVVLGADPPISADEADLVARLAREVSDFLVVLNKADLVSPDDRAKAVAFCARVLGERLSRPAPEILPVCAQSGPQDPGFRELVQRIAALAEGSAARLARRALARGTRRLVAALQAGLALERRSLTGDLDDLQAQIATLRRESGKLGRLLDTMTALLRVDCLLPALRAEPGLP